MQTTENRDKQTPKTIVGRMIVGTGNRCYGEGGTVEDLASEKLYPGDTWSVGGSNISLNSTLAC